jgi:GT2 family glycosyltransferase
MSPWVAWEQLTLNRQYEAMNAGWWQATARQFYTGNAAVHRSHLTRAGGFDPSFRRAEDIELAHRLAAHGLSFRFCSEAVGYHYAERPFSSWCSAAYQYGRNDIRIARDQDVPWLYDFVRRAYQNRSALAQRSIMITVGSAPARASLRWAVGLLTRGSIPRLWGIQRRALSALYAVEYNCGVADEMGSQEAFRKLMLGKSAASG